MVKNLAAMQEMQETWVWSLGWEDLLEEEIASHSSILAWRIPLTEEPGGSDRWSNPCPLHWQCRVFITGTAREAPWTWAF